MKGKTVAIASKVIPTERNRKCEFLLNPKFFLLRTPTMTSPEIPALWPGDVALRRRNMFSFYINDKVSFENISADKKGIGDGRAVIEGDEGAEPFGANAEFDLHDGPLFNPSLVRT